MTEEIKRKEKINWDKVRLLLAIGIVGAGINLAGDVLMGWGVRNTRLPGIEGQISQYLTIADWRMFWSALLGLIGVPISAIGHIGIYTLIKPYSKKYARLYSVGIFGAFTFGGSGVHISSVAAAFFYKYMTSVSPETALAASIKFVCYFPLPLCIALLTCVLIQSYAHIRALVTGLTPYPRWCWLCSLPVGTLLISFVNLFGNYALVNAIMVGIFSLGNIWTQSWHLMLLDKAKKNWKKLFVFPASN